MKSPSFAAQKWSRNIGAATKTIEEGVQNVTVSPTEKAAARADAYAQGCQNAVLTQKFQNSLRRVSLDQWKQAMLQKGLQRIAGGAAAAVTKMEQFFAEFLPFLEAGVRALPPRGDIEANKQRVLAMIDHNARFRRRT